LPPNRGAEEENATKKPKHSGKKKTVEWGRKGVKGGSGGQRGTGAAKGESQLLQVCKFYLCVLLWAYLKRQSFGKSDSDSNSGIEGEPIEDGTHIWQGFCMCIFPTYIDGEGLHNGKSKRCG